MDGPVPLRATAWAGALLAVAAIGLLAGLVVVDVPLDHGAVLPLHGTVPVTVCAIARLAASAVLAVGAPGVVGGSVVGRVALVVFGAQHLLLVVGTPVLPSFVLTLVLSAAVQLVVVAAGVIAAAAVLRARRPVGAARWLLVPLLVLEAPRLVVSSVPLPLSAAATVALGESVWLLQLVLLLALAGALLLHGRRAALHERWQVIRDAW